MTDSHTYADPQVDIRDPSSEHPIGYAFLNGKELSLFRLLIEDRRSLPVCRAGGWVCYECPFAATDLAAVAEHIVRAHEATPASRDVLDENDSDLSY
jgi:hypothetical protein